MTSSTRSVFEQPTIGAVTSLAQCQGDPRHRHAEPFREPVHAFDDRHILRTCLIVLVAHGAVGGAAFGIGIPGRMGQMAGRHGEYGVSAMLY